MDEGLDVLRTFKSIKLLLVHIILGNNYYLPDIFTEIAMLNFFKHSQLLTYNSTFCLINFISPGETVQ